MKKTKLISTILSLMIILAACGGNTLEADDIYDKIHGMYFDIKSYTAQCTITTFTPGGENSYECKIHYDHKLDTYDITSDDMRMILSGEKTVISKGQNTIESPSLPEDMYIFINTFFKSYYESEDTALTVSTADVSDSVLLECSAINPTEYITSMKLWINSKTAIPQKMQILSKDDSVNTEIIFNLFEFEKAGL